MRHRTARNATKPDRTQQNQTELHEAVRYCPILPGSAQSCPVLPNSVRNCTKLYETEAFATMRNEISTVQTKTYTYSGGEFPVQVCPATVLSFDIVNIPHSFQNRKHFETYRAFFGGLLWASGRIGSSGSPRVSAANDSRLQHLEMNSPAIRINSCRAGHTAVWKCYRPSSPQES